MSYYEKFRQPVAAVALASGVLRVLAATDSLEAALNETAEQLVRLALMRAADELVRLGYEPVRSFTPAAPPIERLKLAWQLLTDFEPRVGGESWAGQDDEAKRLAVTLIAGVLEELNVQPT